VLHALAEEPSTWRYGYELGQQVGLQAGSLYPILMRLCDRGLLEAAWEANPPTGRPARHLYRLTGAGQRLAAETAEAADQASPQPGGLRPGGLRPGGLRPGELRGAW
jgi:DNA-binding PadR family transcriptional regulator